MTFAPNPKKRIFRPLRSLTDLISLRNQPDASGGVMAQGTAWIPCLPNISFISSIPPP